MSDTLATLTIPAGTFHAGREYLLNICVERRSGNPGVFLVNERGNVYRLRARPLPKRPASRRRTGGRLRPLRRAPTLRPGRM